MRIGIVTAKGANVLDVGHDVTKATSTFMANVPQGISIEQIADQPLVVKHAVGEFMRSFVEALVIVLFVSFLALGWRTGLVVALSVPLVLAIVFVVMNYVVVPLSAWNRVAHFTPMSFVWNLLAMLVFGLIVAYASRCFVGSR